MAARPVNSQQTREALSELTLKDRLSAFSNLPRFFRLAWDTNKWMTIMNLVLRILRSAIPVLTLYVAKLIIDEVIRVRAAHGTLSHGHLWRLVAFEFGLVLLSDALNRGITLVDTLLGDLFSHYTSVKIMEHAASLDLDQFEDSSFYDKLERARQQTTGRTILLSQIMSQVQDFITMGFLGAGLLAFNPWLILLLLVAIIPAFLGENYFNDRAYALTRGQTPDRRELDYTRYLGASDETAKEVKLFNLSGFIISRFKLLSHRFYIANRRLAITRSAWGTLFALLGSAGYYGSYLVIIAQTIRGHLSIGSLTFLAGSFGQMRTLLEGVLTRFNNVSLGAIFLRDYFDFFEIKPRMKVAAHPRPFPRPIKTGFTFEDVGFRYSNSERWANRHLNFTLRAGEKLALVGENGAGKTTLVKLLARLYEPTEGRILLDGIDLKEYDIAELRMHIGVIFQDYLRYQMSFAQNIGVGNIEELGNRGLIVTAAQKSLADDLAERLPKKYDQPLGRRFNEGIELSGGEWQKVALARAYMKETQLLILDEPTAALDARAEYEVFQRFAELTKGKSAVLISHRFSTVRMADRILMLNKGEIIEIGSHAELLEKDGRYAELFKLQAMGYQ